MSKEDEVMLRLQGFSASGIMYIKAHSRVTGKSVEQIIKQIRGEK